jgi:hypothetical protein
MFALTSRTLRPVENVRDGGCWTLLLVAEGKRQNFLNLREQERFLLLKNVDASWHVGLRGLAYVQEKFEWPILAQLVSATSSCNAGGNLSVCEFETGHGCVLKLYHGLNAAIIKNEHSRFQSP